MRQILSVVLSISVVCSMVPLASARTIPGVTRDTARASSVQTVSVAAAKPLTCSTMSLKAALLNKKTFVQIPATWSAYADSSIQPVNDQAQLYKNVFFSVAQNGVTFDDLNPQQIDFMEMPGSQVKALVQSIKDRKAAGYTWSSEAIGGRTADVLNYPAPALGGTGGKLYLFAWKGMSATDTSATPATRDMGLVIWKQSVGDADFECGAKAVFASLKLDDFTQRFGAGYPALK